MSHSLIVHGSHRLFNQRSPAHTLTHKTNVGCDRWLKTKEPPWGLPHAHCNAGKHIMCVCVGSNVESREKKEQTEQQWPRVCKSFFSTRLADFRVPQCHCDTLYSRYEAVLVCRSHTLCWSGEWSCSTHTLRSCLSAQSVCHLHSCVYESAKLPQSEMQFITDSARMLKAGRKGADFHHISLGCSEP